MISRSERFQKKKWINKMKYLTGVLVILLTLGIGNVALAGENASSILTKWFDKKANDSINEIDQSIQKEKDKAIKRLQKELKADILESEKELITFTQQEKEKRAQEIQRYTDELINKMDNQDEESKRKIQSELDKITQHAKEELKNATNQ